MASDITVHGLADADAPAVRVRVRRALEVFASVDTTCTRFNPTSPLMIANASPDRWHRVPLVLSRAVEEAHRAHLRTRGRFDPRILRDLVRLGYDRTLAFGTTEVDTPRPSGSRLPLGPWRPKFRGGPRPEIHLGGLPVDLGGIGKGLALRWATERLRSELGSFLIDAGGDCAAAGPGPNGGGWSIGVEDPTDPTSVVAVLELRNAACATSSVRIRHWRSGGADVHHLVDPRTGEPGGAGLRSVTVVAPDPADAEVASKTLFLEGAGGIAEASRRRSAAALWVDADGRVTESPRLDPHVSWRAP